MESSTLPAAHSARMLAGRFGNFWCSLIPVCIQMPTGAEMKSIEAKHIIKLSTNISASCQVCGKWQEAENIDIGVNHYLQEHNAKLLHVGAEAFVDEDGHTAHQTVALIGLDQAPPLRELTPFNVQINLADKD